MGGMVELYNLMCDEAFKLGVDPDKTKHVNTKFSDRGAGEKRCAAMHSLVRAAIESHKAIQAENQKKENDVAKAEAKAQGKKAPATTKEAAPKVDKAAAKAEKQAAAEKALAEKVAAKKKAADDKLAAAQKMKDDKAAAKAKAKAEAVPKSKYDYKAKIKVLVDKNPLKEGTEAFADFGRYKSGMTVGEFMAIVGTKKGGVRLHFDTGANRIAIA
jgi:membrane protein involved in colicin uptake